MIRFLLSLLALVSGLVVPGVAEARTYSACETEIGATIQPGREAAPAVLHRAVLRPVAHPACTAKAAPVLAMAKEPPAPIAVLIGIDRAHI